MWLSAEPFGLSTSRWNERSGSVHQRAPETSVSTAALDSVCLATGLKVVVYCLGDTDPRMMTVQSGKTKLRPRMAGG